MSRRYIDADNMKMVLMCTEKELTIEDIVNYIDNNICNDVIPIEKLEQVREHFEAIAHFNGTVKADYVLRMLDKAIKEQNEV